MIIRIFTTLPKSCKSLSKNEKGLLHGNYKEDAEVVITGSIEQRPLLGGIMVRKYIIQMFIQGGFWILECGASNNGQALWS